MPPKKATAKAEKPVEPEPEFTVSNTSIPDDINYLTDLNDQFFERASKIIQNLAMKGRTFEASKIKRYTDILYNLHRRYVEEVRINSELLPMVEAAKVKLSMALDVSVDTQGAIHHMKDTLTLAWKENDASMLREQASQKKMQEMVIKCETLDVKVSEKVDDTAEFGQLAKYKNIILRERDRLNGEVVDLEKRLQFQRYYAESVEYINKTQEDNYNKLQIRARVLESEQSSLLAKIRNLMTNLEDQRDTHMKFMVKHDAVSKELADTTNKLERKTADYELQKVVLEKHRNANVLHTKQAFKYEEDLSELRKLGKEMEDIIRGMRLEDKIKSNTINILIKKNKKASEDVSNMESKLYKMNRHNNTLQSDILRLKNTINALEKTVLTWTQKYDDLRHLKDNMQRERDVLRSDVQKLNNNIGDLKHSIVIQNTKIDNLNLDINKRNVKLDEAKIHIAKAEKERNEMAQQVVTLEERIEYFQEQLKLKTNLVSDLTTKLQNKQFQLINVKKNLESVHADKMMLQRNLDTCMQERDNLRLLLTKASYQIHQLTTEILANQTTIGQLKLRIERLNNEKKELETELKNKENILSSVRRDLKDAKIKIESLLKKIEEDEFKFMQIAQTLDELRKEKNLVGLQMVRRNDEIVILKEKLEMMQCSLDRGQTQYNQRLADVRLLKAEIRNLQTERECLKRTINSTADMRMEIVRLNRLVSQERIKVRALTEDAKTPTGVHRWRFLRGIDPQRFEMLQQMQSMQRRNLQQELVKTNLLNKLKTTTETANALKQIIDNFPKAELKTKLVLSQRAHRRQLEKAKAATAELSIDQVELNARQFVLKRVRETFNAIKEELKLDAAIVQRFEACFDDDATKKRIHGGQDKHTASTGKYTRSFELKNGRLVYTPKSKQKKTAKESKEAADVQNVAVEENASKMFAESKGFLNSLLVEAEKIVEEPTTADNSNVHATEAKTSESPIAKDKLTSAIMGSNSGDMPEIKTQYSKHSDELHSDQMLATNETPASVAKP